MSRMAFLRVGGTAKSPRQQQIWSGWLGEGLGSGRSDGLGGLQEQQQFSFGGGLLVVQICTAAHQPGGRASNRPFVRTRSRMISVLINIILRPQVQKGSDPSWRDRPSILIRD